MREIEGFYRLWKISGVEGLFDLSNGSLDTDMIGLYEGFVEIYSAEALLCELDCMENAEITRIWVPEERIWWKE